MDFDFLNFVGGTVLGGIVVPIALHFFGKEKLSPNIESSDFSDRYHSIILENIGNETLSQFNVHADWILDGKKDGREHEELNFWDVSQDIGMEHPKARPRVLQTGSRVKISGLCSVSDDGKLHVVVSGKGVNTQKNYRKEFTLTNKIQPKK